MTNVDRANEIFGKVGEKYGYKNVSVDFTAYKQFKVQWSRSYNWIQFRVSDYIQNAPAEILEDLASALFERISGKEGMYSERFRAYILSPEFSQTHAHGFIKRGRYLSFIDENDQKSLRASVNRLVDAGLIPEDHNLWFAWNHDTRSDMASTYSVLMRTIMVHSDLNDAEIPDEVIDYVIYNQYVHIKEGVRTFDSKEEPSVREDLKKFPNHDEMEKTLDKMCLAL